MQGVNVLHELRHRRAVAPDLSSRVAFADAISVLEADEHTRSGDDLACRVWGCREDAACPGGCAWAAFDDELGLICTRCDDEIEALADAAAIAIDGWPARDEPLEGGSG